MYLQIQKKEFAANGERDESAKKNDIELISEINQQYALSSRFSGKTMDISFAGQEILCNIILSRITLDNIDRIARILSSNVCENYFSMLTQFTHGKRKNTDFTDTWRVQQYMIAGLKSNANFTSLIFEKIGVSKSFIRTRYMERKVATRNYHKKYDCSEQQIARRKMTTQVRNHLLQKFEKNSGRHISEKVKPTETTDKSKKRRKKSKCGNCGKLGHNRTNCVEPDERNKSSENDKAVDSIINLFKF